MSLHPLQPANETDSVYARFIMERLEQVQNYLHNRIRELLTNYGGIDSSWLDFSYPNSDGYCKGRNDQVPIVLFSIRPRGYFHGHGITPDGLFIPLIINDNSHVLGFLAAWLSFEIVMS